MMSILVFKNLLNDLFFKNSAELLIFNNKKPDLIIDIIQEPIEAGIGFMEIESTFIVG